MSLAAGMQVQLFDFNQMLWLGDNLYLEMDSLAIYLWSIPPNGAQPSFIIFDHSAVHDLKRGWPMLKRFMSRENGQPLNIRLTNRHNDFVQMQNFISIHLHNKQMTFTETLRDLAKNELRFSTTITLDWQHFIELDSLWEAITHIFFDIYRYKKITKPRRLLSNVERPTSTYKLEWNKQVLRNLSEKEEQKPTERISSSSSSSDEEGNDTVG